MEAERERHLGPRPRHRIDGQQRRGTEHDQFRCARSITTRSPPTCRRSTSASCLTFGATSSSLPGDCGARAGVSSVAGDADTAEKRSNREDWPGGLHGDTQPAKVPNCRRRHRRASATCVDADRGSDGPASAAMPSPFPPIAEYAFLSDCHTGALVAPDGSVDWLCVPRFDSPSVFGSLLDREAGTLPVRPVRHQRPDVGAAYEPGTNVLVTTWKTPSGWVVVRDALTMGPTPGPTWSRRTPGRRPTTTPSTSSCARRSASTATSRWSSCASRCSTTGASPATWTLADDDGHAADATRRGGDRPAADRPVARDRGRPGPGPPRAAGRASGSYCSLSWADGLRRPGRRRRRRAAHRRHGAVLAELAGPAPGSPITATGSRSSAPRSPSRASPTCRPARRWPR